MLQEVMQTEDSVNCELTSKGNLPALKVMIQELTKQSANLIEETEIRQRDVLLSKGGSVSNVISTGLRILALLRVTKTHDNHRKFIVLDEPDAWLSPDKIEAFATLLTEIAKNLEIQILLITHHDTSYFKNASLLKLHKENDIVKTEVLNEDFNWLNEDKNEFFKGIQGIKLVDYMSHENTYIPLSRFLTVLTGKNDIGKSAIIQSIHDVAYGTGSDLIIKDKPVYKKQAKVFFYFESGCLEWNRNRKIDSKNTSKELYTLSHYEDGFIENYKQLKQNTFVDNSLLSLKEPFEIKSGGNGYTGVPDFVRDKDCLGISKVEDIDIQIRNQKEPIFLINESPTTQAKILSIGQEIAYLQSMRENYKISMQLDKKLVDKGEKELNSIYNLLQSLEEVLEKIKPKATELNERLKKLIKI